MMKPRLTQLSWEKERTRTVGAVLAAALLLGTGAACTSDGSSSEPSADTSSGPSSAPESTGVVQASGSGEGELPQGGEKANLDPAEFTIEIDNPYWPMTPGNRWVYEEIDTDGTVQKVVVTVTDKTKMIANGIEARVVRDVVSSEGELVEVTDDWYAQDATGNIWYLGEETAEYENGKPVSTSGSFEAGVDGAEAGIAMPANPEDGMAYRQEYYKGEAEDRAEVLSLDEKAEVKFGYFKATLMTKDLVPTEPKVSEHKFYAKGVGPVLTLDISGGTGREELLSFRQG